MQEALVSMERITKKFLEATALSNVDFSVRYGEVLGLVGDNGAGKSTLVKILIGVYQADAGEIYFEGKRITNHTPATARDLGIEIIYQDLALVEDLDIPSNIFLGRPPTHRGLGGFLGVIDKKKRANSARELLCSLDIKIDSMKKCVNQIPGGQRQAVAIARTMTATPKLVIMDEPTAAISIMQKEKVMNLARKLKHNNISVIIISHNMDEVFSVADRIVVLNRGQKAGDKEIHSTSHDEIVDLIIGGKDGGDNSELGLVEQAKERSNNLGNQTK